MKRLPQAIEDLVTNTVLAVDDRRLLRYDVRRACYKAYRLGQRRARARAALLDWRAAQRGSKVIVEAVRTGKIKLGLDSHPLRIDTIEGLGPRVKVGTRWTAAGRQAVSDFVREKGGHSKPASLGPTSGPQNFLPLSRKLLGKNPVMKSKMRRRIFLKNDMVRMTPSGLCQGLACRAQRYDVENGEECVGRVTSDQKRPLQVWVRQAGRKTSSCYHVKFWEIWERIPS